METLLAGVISFAVFYVLFVLLVLQPRSNEILRKHLHVLDLIHRYSQNLLAKNDPGWIAPYNDLKGIKVSRIALMFWIPVDAFYEPLIKRYKLDELEDTDGRDQAETNG